VENEEFLEYYEFYKIVTKDRVAFESIYWLFSIRWIEFIQANNNASSKNKFWFIILKISRGKNE